MIFWCNYKKIVVCVSNNARQDRTIGNEITRIKCRFLVFWPLMMEGRGHILTTNDANFVTIQKLYLKFIKSRHSKMSFKVMKYFFSILLYLKFRWINLSQIWRMVFWLLLLSKKNRTLFFITTPLLRVLKYKVNITLLY